MKSFDWENLPPMSEVVGIHKETGVECPFIVVAQEGNQVWIKYEEIYTEGFRVLDYDGWVYRKRIEEKSKLVAIELLEDKLCCFKEVKHWL